MDLRDLCKLYNYTLVEDPAPELRKDALGCPGLQDEVQLCEDRVIAVGPNVHKDSVVYGVSHELAHGIVGFCDEKDVLYEQAVILARWTGALLKELHDTAQERRDQRSGKGPGGDHGQSKGVRARGV